MELTASQFKLRVWQAGDEQSLQQQADNYNISRFLFNSFPYPYTIDEAERWVTSHQNQDPITNFATVIDENVAGGIEFKRDKDVHAKTPH
jgi:ribosomal-protein-alanine N-acetyltransferase